MVASSLDPTPTATTSRSSAVCPLSSRLKLVARASSMDMSMESHSFSHSNGFMPMPSINEVGNDALFSINSFPCSPENNYTCMF